MAQNIWLSNDDSDVSGYKVAYLGFRSPNASSTVSTATTGTNAVTVGSGVIVAMTATSGGTAVKWITAPFKSDVTIAGAVVSNFWGLESAAANNAGIGVQLYEYTTSEQSVFFQASAGSEIAITTANQQLAPRGASTVASTVGDTYTSTTIDAGNRLVIKPIVVNVGTMIGGGTVTMDYNGATAGADGDTYITLTETPLSDQVQYPASGGVPSAPGLPSVIGLTSFRTLLDPVVQQIASNDATWATIKNELQYLADATGA